MKTEQAPGEAVLALKEKMKGTMPGSVIFILPDSGIEVNMRKPSFNDLTAEDPTIQTVAEGNLSAFSLVSTFDGLNVNYRDLTGISAMDYIELQSQYRKLTEKAEPKGKPESSAI